jgi:hypothetical protein
VQRRVITLAKLTPERAWLDEVASVALVQASQDARRAYKNWFGSRTGCRTGPKIGYPKPRRKHGRQSIRLTRNGFARHGECSASSVEAGRITTVPARPAQVVEPVGAGDAFAAGFLYARLRQMSPVEASRLGHLVASPTLT